MQVVDEIYCLLLLGIRRACCLCKLLWSGLFAWQTSCLPISGKAAGILQAKMHNFIVVDSHGCHEGGFLMVVRVHRNLVVSEENIHESHQQVSYCCPLACRCKLEERDPLHMTY